MKTYQHAIPPTRIHDAIVSLRRTGRRVYRVDGGLNKVTGIRKPLNDSELRHLVKKLGLWKGKQNAGKIRVD